MTRPLNYLIAYWSGEPYGWKCYSYDSTQVFNGSDNPIYSHTPAESALAYVQSAYPSKPWQIVWIPSPDGEQ